MQHATPGFMSIVDPSLCIGMLAATIDVSCAWVSEPLHESPCDWGDPWVDPQGILGGSNPDSGDPATLTRVKIGGSTETTSPLYNIKKGDQ